MEETKVAFENRIEDDDYNCTNYGQSITITNRFHVRSRQYFQSVLALECLYVESSRGSRHLSLIESE